MTTSLVHSSTGLLWWTPEATPGTTNDADYPSQAEVTQCIANGDVDVEIRTGTTNQSTKRDHILREYVKAWALEYIKNKKGPSATAIQTLTGSISLSGDFYKHYLQLCEAFLPHTTKSRHKMVAHDYSEVVW